MAPLQIVFLLVAAATLGCGLVVVTTRKMLHAALWMVLCFFGVAILFAILQAGFFAVVQVVVYIGAISILIIFAVMLTRRVMEDVGTQENRGWPVAAGATLLLLAGLLFAISRWSSFSATPPDYPAQVQSQSVTQLGMALVSPTAYVIPFETASVLLLAALVGAIYISLEKK